METLLIINTIALVLLLIIITAIVIKHFLELKEANKKISQLEEEKEKAEEETKRYCNELKKRYGDESQKGYDLSRGRDKQC